MVYVLAAWHVRVSERAKIMQCCCWLAWRTVNWQVCCVCSECPATANVLPPLLCCIALLADGLLYQNSCRGYVEGACLSCPRHCCLHCLWWFKSSNV